MKRLGVVLEPDCEISRRNFAVLNGAVFFDSNEGLINIFPREVNEKQESSIGWDVFDLNHRHLYCHEGAIFTGNGLCYEDSRIICLSENSHSRFVMSLTLAKPIFIEGRKNWQTRIGLASADKIPVFQLFAHNLPSESNKNGVLFPQKVNGFYYIFHRLWPNVHLARSEDLFSWEDLGCVMTPLDGWQGSHIGAGAPPLKIEHGWLLFYHAASRGFNGRFVYSMGAALFDLQDPSQLLARTQSPLLFPEASYELNGWVPNVVFPTGAIEINGIYRIYYGAADRCIACCELDQTEVFNQLSPV